MSYYSDSFRDCLNLNDRLLEKYGGVAATRQSHVKAQFREAVEACKRAGLISVRATPSPRTPGHNAQTTLRLNAAVDEYLAMPQHHNGDLKEIAAKWDVHVTAMCYRMARLHERRAEVRKTARNTYATEVA